MRSWSASLRRDRTPLRRARQYSPRRRRAPYADLRRRPGVSRDSVWRWLCPPRGLERHGLKLLGLDVGALRELDVAHRVVLDEPGEVGGRALEQVDAGAREVRLHGR